MVLSYGTSDFRTVGQNDIHDRIRSEQGMNIYKDLTTDRFIKTVCSLLALKQNLDQFIVNKTKNTALCCGNYKIVGKYRSLVTRKAVLMVSE